MERGSHKDLLKNPESAYKKLVEAQHLDAKDIKEPSSTIAPLIPVAIKGNEVGASNHGLAGDIENGIIAKRSTFEIFVEILKLNKPEIKYLIPGNK